MVRYEQKSKKRRSGVQREKRKEKGRNGAEESHSANKKSNARGMMPREFPATRQSDFSSHEPLPRTPSDLLQIEMNRTVAVTKYENRENPSG